MGGTTLPASRIVPSPAGSKRSFTATQPASLLDNGRVKFEITFSNLAGVQGTSVVDTTDDSKVVSGNVMVVSYEHGVAHYQTLAHPANACSLCFHSVGRSGSVPKGPKSPGRQESISFTGPTGVALGLVVSVAAVIGVALIVLSVVFRRQRRQMLALQRVLDSSAAALNHGAHSSSSINMAAISTSIGTDETDRAARSDADLALLRTAVLYESLPNSVNSPA